MSPTIALLTFTLAAAVLTIMPGMDTALVLRTAAVEGPRQAVSAVYDSGLTEPVENTHLLAGGCLRQVHNPRRPLLVVGPVQLPHETNH